MKTLINYINEANLLKANTFETKIIFKISFYEINSNKFDAGVIEIVNTEKEAQYFLKAMKEEQDIELFYKPFVVNEFTGVILTSENLKSYNAN